MNLLFVSYTICDMICSSMFHPTDVFFSVAAAVLHLFHQPEKGSLPFKIKGSPQTCLVSKIGRQIIVPSSDGDSPTSDTAGVTGRGKVSIAEAGLA